PVEDYDIVHLAGDVVGLIDALGEERGVLVGHDWGAMVGWHVAQAAPERLHGFAALSIPFWPRPPKPPTAMFKEMFGDRFFYMLHFQTPGVADAELDADAGAGERPAGVRTGPRRRPLDPAGAPGRDQRGPAPLPGRSLALERAGHAEDVLADVGQDEVGRDRRHLVEAGLAELPLDVVLLGEAVPAVELDGDVGRLPRGLRRQQLGHVGLGAAVLAGVEQVGGPPAHEVGGLDADVGPGDGELHALVGADRPAEHHPLAGITGDPVDEPAAVADA